ncbi:hypothetical protein ACFLZH_05535 [Patescibacteria group bacterium]
MSEKQPTPGEEHVRVVHGEVVVRPEIPGDVRGYDAHVAQEIFDLLETWPEADDHDDYTYRADDRQMPVAGTVSGVKSDCNRVTPYCVGPKAVLDEGSEYNEKPFPLEKLDILSDAFVERIREEMPALFEGTIDSDSYETYEFFGTGDKTLEKDDYVMGLEEATPSVYKNISEVHARAIRRRLVFILKLIQETYKKLRNLKQLKNKKISFEFNVQLPYSGIELVVEKNSSPSRMIIHDGNSDEGSIEIPLDLRRNYEKLIDDGFSEE